MAVYDRHIAAPLQYVDIFQALNIGLIGVSDSCLTVYYDPEINRINSDKHFLASKRAYSVIDHTQDSFMVRKHFVAGGIPV